MRVLYVTHQYPPAIGGSEKYIADLAVELVARGHRIDVYTSRSLDYHTWKSELEPREHVNGVDIYRFHAMRRTRLAWRILLWSLGRYWQGRSRWVELPILLSGGPVCPGMFAALLSKLPRYDVVHLNCLVYSHAAYGYLAARWRGVPIVITPHAHANQEVTYGIGYQLAVLRGSDHVLADTEGERDLMLTLGVEPGRVTTAGIGLRPGEYPARDKVACRRRLGLAENAFVVLFMGRQVEYKGLGALYKAFCALRERHPSLALVIAGPETEYSQQLFAHSSGEPGLVNLGMVSDDGRLDVINACDCLALPSAGEAFGIVFLEAWIAGKPVIGPRSAAGETLIRDGWDGWLVPTGDSSAIVEALEQWIDDPARTRQMGESGRQRVLQHHTWARTTEIVLDVYQRVVQARGQARAASRAG
jgi:glycosyltransferase involved in cell wall biosynthesis